MSLLDEAKRFLPILEALERDPEQWAKYTRGTGIATLNGYREAIRRVEGVCDIDNQTIKPCPFCGGEAIAQPINPGMDWHRVIDWHRVVCASCGIGTRWTNNLGFLILQWNARVIDPDAFERSAHDLTPCAFCGEGVYMPEGITPVMCIHCETK